MSLDQLFRANRIARLIAASGGDIERTIDSLRTKLADVDYAICGGVALAVYGIPRNTEDIDILVANEAEVDKIEERLRGEFKRNRPHSFEHKQTGVEVEVLTPQFINYSYAEVFVETPVVFNGFKFVTMVNLINMKLKSFREQDQVDIKKLVTPDRLEEVRSYIDTELVDKFDSLFKPSLIGE